MSLPNNGKPIFSPRVKIVYQRRVYEVRASTAPEARAVLDKAYAEAKFGAPVVGKDYISFKCECSNSGKRRKNTCVCPKCGWTL